MHSTFCRLSHSRNGYCSILGRNVIIERGAIVRDSIVMEGCVLLRKVCSRARYCRPLNIIPQVLSQGTSEEILIQRKNNKRVAHIVLKSPSVANFALSMQLLYAFFQVVVVLEMFLGSLPQALSRARVVVVSPLYSSIKPEWKQRWLGLRELQVPLWRFEYCGLWHLVHEGVVFTL